MKLLHLLKIPFKRFSSGKQNNILLGQQSISNRRLFELLDVIVALSMSNFSKKATIFNDDTAWDAMAGAINVLADELHATTVSKDYFDNIINSMLELLLVVSPKGVILKANEAASQLLDCAYEALIGSSIDRFLDQETLFVPKFLKTFHTPQGFETELYTNTKIKVPVLLSISPLKDSQKGYVLVAKDITKQKEAENKIVASQEKLRALSKKLMIIQEEERKYIAREIHDDLGQWLTVIKMDLQGLKQDLKPETASLEKLNIVIENVQQVVNTVRQISTRLRPPPIG